MPITGLAAVNKFPKATAPQPMAGNIVSGPLAGQQYSSLWQLVVKSFATPSSYC